MKIVSLISENVKKIRVVEIEPKGRVIQVTGKNGQGKTSVLDSIWIGLAGKRAMPEKPVRKGAEKLRIKLNLGEIVVTRTFSTTGAMTLAVESAEGNKFSSPQAMLDELLGELTFDPLAFVGMDVKRQINALRSVVKLEIDIEALNAATLLDFAKRREVNRDVERVRSEIVTITVQAGLPKDKQDESAILAKLNDASALNEKARKADEEHRALQSRYDNIVAEIAEQRDEIRQRHSKIAEIKKALDAAEKSLVADEAKLKSMTTKAESALQVAQNSKPGEFVDVSQLTKQLQDAQLVNREIDKRTRREALEKELKGYERESDALTRAMEDREELKRTSMASAKMPVDGLSFDEEHVLYNGIPLAQLGEAEQIKISTSIAMAANPKLRVMLIQHGEALDDDALAMLAELAEKNDFQVWMARVDSSGKNGIVMEDGSVKADLQ